MLRVTLSSIGDAVISTDTEGRVVFMNPVAERLTGWTQNEATGQPLETVFHIVNEETRQTVDNPVQKVLAEGVVAGLANHTLLIAKDGTECSIDDSAAPIHDDDGTLSGVVLVFRDITQRREAERAIAEARAYTESIVDTVREPLLVLNADLRVQSASRSFYRNFRVTPEETEGRHLYELGNGQWDIPALRKLLEEILPQNTAFHDFEVEHTFPTIGPKTMLLNARRIHRDGDRTELILLAIEDITERRQAEEARREAETRYTSLVRNIKDHSIFMTDAEGNITSWNKEAERIIGYSEEEILGRSFSVIFSPEDIQRGVPEQELRIAREQGRAEDERWHVRKDGSRFWALGIVTPRHDGRGNLEGFSKILRDMTDRKLAEQLLHEQSEALKEADQRKNDFLAMLGHELRNPLAGIANGVQVLKMVGSDGQDAVEMQDVIERQAGHMAHLIDDLLDVSRISRGKILLRKKRVDLAEVVRSTVEGYRRRMEEHGLILALNLPDESLWIDGDPIRLAQVVGNIVNNAMKFTDPGGRISVILKNDDGMAKVTVTDTGIGMEPHLIQRLFEPFHQADSSLDRSRGGLGLGLALVKGLAEMHGGKVEARSFGLGQGTEIEVRLPLVGEGPAPESSTAKQPAAAKNYRVLLIDDRRDSILPLQKMLKLLGQKVETAIDGKSALEKARQFQPEIVLCDIGLPDMNGYEVARAMRSDPILNSAYLVAVTGYGKEEDRRQAVQSGFDYHITKPVAKDQLEKLLATFPRFELSFNGAGP